MPTENSKVALEFDADDVIEGLIKFIQHGEKAEAILGAIAVAGTKMAYDLIIDLKKTTEAVIQPFTQAAQVVAHVDKAFKDAKESVRQVRTEAAKMNLSDWEKQALDYRNQLKKMKDDYKELKAASLDVNRSDAERLELAAKLKAAKQEINQLALEQAKHVHQLKEAEEARLATEQKRLQARQRQAQEQQNTQIKSSGTEGAQNLAASAGIASAALSLALGNATNKYAEFEGQLKQYSVIAKASKEETEQFKNTAMSLSVMAQSSDSVANLGAELAKAGLTASETNRAISTITTAAVAMDDELVASGETIDSVRTQFGLGIEEIDRVANGLVLAANESKISLSDLNESYKYFGATAAQIKQPLEDSNALLVLLGNSGIKASKAGNGLQNTFLRLADPKIRAEIKKIGVDVLDSSGNIRQMTDIVLDLKKAMKGATAPNQAAFFKEMFGEVAVEPMLALLNQTEEKIKSTRKTMENWSGVQDKIADEMRGGFQFSLKELIITIDNFQKAFIESLGPALIPIFKSLTLMIDGFRKLHEPIKLIISTGTVAATISLALAAGFGAISLAGGSLILSLGKVANAFVLYTTGAPAVAAANLTVGQSFTAIKSGASAIPGLFTRMLASASSTLPIIAGQVWAVMAPFAPFIALAAALYAAWELNLGGFRDLMTDALGAIGLGIEEASAWWGAEITEMSDIWEWFWQGAKDTAFTVLGAIDAILRGAFDVIGNLFGAAGDLWFGNWSGAWDSIGKVLEGVTFGLSKHLGSWIKSFGDIFSQGMRGLGEMAAGLWDVITNPTDTSAGMDRIKAGFETIKSAVSKGAEGMKSSWDSVFDNILADANKMRDKGKELLAGDDPTTPKSKRDKKNDPAKPDPNNAVLNKQLLDMLSNGKGKGENPYLKAAKDFTAAQDHALKMQENSTELQIEQNNKVVTSSEEARKAIATTAQEWVRSGKADAFAKKDVAGSLFAIGKACDRTVQEMMRLGGVSDEVLKMWTSRVPASINNLKKAGYIEQVTTPSAGDIVVARDSSHTGLYTGNGKIIDARNSRGKEINKKQRVVEGNQWMKGASFYRLTDKALTGVVSSPNNSEHAKQMKKIEGDKNAMLAYLTQIELKMKGLNKSDKKQYEAWEHYNSKRRELTEKLGKMQVDYQKALNKAEEEHRKNVAATQKMIETFQERIEQRKNSLKNVTADEQMTAERMAEKANVTNDYVQKFRDFKGDDGQRSKMQQQLREELALVDQQFDKKDLERKRQLENDLRQIEIEYMEQGFERRKAEIELNLKNTLHELTEKQKLYKEDSDEWKRLQASKIHANNKANRQIVQEGIKATQDLVQAQEATLLSGLSNTERQFVASFESMMQEAADKGLKGKNLFDFLTKKDNAYNLADTLGAGNFEQAIVAINSKLATTKTLVEQAQKELANESDALKKEEAQQRLNTLLAQQNLLQKMVNSSGDEGFKLVVTSLQKLIPEQKRWNTELESTFTILQSVASAFGELAMDGGSQLAEVINTAQTVVNSIQKIQSIATLSQEVEFLNPENIQDLTGAVVQLVNAGLQIGKSFVGAFSDVYNKTSYQKHLQQASNHEIEQAIATEKEKLRIRKEAGEETLQAELSLINQEADFRLEKNKQAGVELSQREGTGSFLGLINFETNEDRLKKQRDLYAIQDERDQIERDRAAQAESATRAAAERRQRLIEASEDRIAETRILAAMNANDRIAEIDAQADKQRMDNKRALAEALAKGGLDTDAINKLMAFFAAEDERLNQETAQKKRDARADENRAALDEEYRHREHVINLKDDGFQKELELMKVSRDRELAMLDNEMARHEESSDEYKRLASERADAEEAAQQRISQARAENQKKRREYNQDLAASIAQLKAQLTDSTSDDILASAQGDLSQINREEEAERRQAIADFGEDQEILDSIAQKYQLRRANRYREIEKGTLDAIRADYEKAEKEKLDAQLKPIELAIKAEERKIAALQKQNAEYEKQLALIDERYEKLNKDFDARDKTEFEGKLGEIDLQKALGEGIDHIANTDINGEKLDRSSVATQRRGLNELLAQQEKDAKSALGLEEINQAQFSAEMERIILLRAASTQAAMEDAKTDRERSDLKAELAEQYIAYQELIKERFEEQRKAEGRQYEQEIRNNNTEIRKSQEVVESKKADLEVLQTAYDERMQAINNAVSGVNMSHQEWLSKIMGVEPAMAEAARAAVQSLGKIKQEYGAFLASMGMPSSVTVRGEEIQLHSGGYQTGFYNQDGTGIAQVPSRTKASSDADGVFSILGPDGKYYRTTSEMMRANDPSGFEDGGDTPDLPQYWNDRAIVRTSAGEKILNRVNSAHMNDMLSFWKARQTSIINNSTGVNNSFYFDISSDVDIVKIENVFNRCIDKRDRMQLKRMGPNAQKRG